MADPMQATAGGVDHPPHWGTDDGRFHHFAGYPEIQPTRGYFPAAPPAGPEPCDPPAAGFPVDPLCPTAPAPAPAGGVLATVELEVVRLDRRAPRREEAAAGDYLVSSGGPWYAARWGRDPADRESGWAFRDAAGAAIRPTWWLQRPPG